MKFWLFLLVFEVCLLGSEHVPMKVDFQDSVSYQWLNKNVLESRLMDDMEENVRAC